MPEWKKEITMQLASLKLPPAREAEIVEEVALHLDDRYRELLAGGAPEAEARRAALEEISEEKLLAKGLERVEHQETQEPIALGAGEKKNILADLWQDLRYGLRMLRTNPGFTAIAVLTLALGVGANTAIFSVAEATMLRPWPVRAPEQLVKIIAHTHDGVDTFSYADYRDLLQQSRSLEGIVAYSRHGPILQTETESQSILAEYVSGNYFAVLGIPAARGRAFLDSAQENASQQRTVVISDTLWHRAFHGDPSLVGKPIVVSGGNYTVIGVAPPHVRGFEPGMPTEAWLLATDEGDQGSRGSGDFELIGRMRSGVTATAVRAELDLLGRRLADAYPATDKGRDLRVITERDRLRQAMVPIFLLMAPVGLILLICCANIAALVLARAETRRREIALRLALGAGRGRLVRQLVTESMLLALAGAGLGLALAGWLFRMQPALMPPSDILQELDLRMDGSPILFAFVVTLIAVVFFGLAPAFQASKVALIPALKGETDVPRRGKFPFTFRNALVAGEIALSVVLVAASGLLVRSFLFTEALAPGFGVQKNLLFFQPFPTIAGYDLERTSRFFQQAKEKVSVLPGVKRVSIARHLMLTDPGGWIIQRVTVPGVELPPDQPNVPIRFNAVDPGYFQTVGTNILEGRDFTRADGPAAPKVVLINRTMARRFWPATDPVGRHILAEGRDCQVIGVAEDARISRIHEPPQPYMYFPFAQASGSEATLIVEATGEALAMAPMIQGEIRKMDPKVPVSVSDMQEVMSSVLWVDRMAAGFGTVLGLLAIVLATVGLYGVISYLANRRRNEFGVRMALGASRRDVLQLVIWDGLKLSVVGTLVGLPISAGVTRLMTTMLYGVSPGDPGVFAFSAGVAILVALVAAYLPARRATRVDPMVALRYE
jgi:predicted permease